MAAFYVPAQGAADNSLREATARYSAKNGKAKVKLTAKPSAISSFSHSGMVDIVVSGLPRRPRDFTLDARIEGPHIGCHSVLTAEFDPAVPQSPVDATGARGAHFAFEPDDQLPYCKGQWTLNLSYGKEPLHDSEFEVID